MQTHQRRLDCCNYCMMKNPCVMRAWVRANQKKAIKTVGAMQSSRPRAEYLPLPEKLEPEELLEGDWFSPLDILAVGAV